MGYPCVLMCHCLGPLNVLNPKEIKWRDALEVSASRDRQEDPPLKNFVPRNKNLPILDSYPVGKDLGEEYWGTWIENPYRVQPGSMMDHEAVEHIAGEVGYLRKTKVEEIVKTLKYGADLHIEGEGRWPSVGRNKESIATHGAKLVEALQTTL